MTGQGSLNYPNGKRYEGEFFEGEKHGMGKWTSARGDHYEG